MVVEDDVKRDFAGVLRDAYAVVLWGSHAKGTAQERSDVDVCIVAGPATPIDAALRAAWAGAGSSRRYDVHAFEELPLFLQGAILEHGRVILARDEAALSEYLRPYRKRWEDERRRAIPSADDMRRILAARRAKGSS